MSGCGGAGQDACCPRKGAEAVPWPLSKLAVLHRRSEAGPAPAAEGGWGLGADCPGMGVGSRRLLSWGTGRELVGTGEGEEGGRVQMEIARHSQVMLTSAKGQPHV